MNFSLLLKNISSIILITFTTFIIFVVCTSTDHIMDTTSNTCVCKENYYQTSTDSDGLPVCTTCPTGSTRTVDTSADACGKHNILITLPASHNYSTKMESVNTIIFGINYTNLAVVNL